MRTNKPDFFWDNEPFPGSSEKAHNTPEENDFIRSYREMIRGEQTRKAAFDPFEKLKKEQKKHRLIVRRVLSYAASVVIAVSMFFAFQHHQHRKAQTRELAELQKNTSQALLYFSKELNACLTQLEDAQKKMGEPVTSIQALKNININKNNPFKNINFNQL